ncbi:hypothetical protein NM208_g14506 [Fusarium decemcellulare]|uniref:Uncharacterized protein n=1 Tax=Fusarium decemcellulare TaxID=57161 RepID=A0ACC1RFU4_9HYPO|nr:hypothetical protein NM208_g14506 [Fusarium decemcellulare]
MEGTDAMCHKTAADASMAYKKLWPSVIQDLPNVDVVSTARIHQLGLGLRRAKHMQAIHSIPEELYRSFVLEFCRLAAENPFVLYVDDGARCATVVQAYATVSLTAEQPSMGIKRKRDD